MGADSPSAIIGLRAAFAHQRNAANCHPPVPKPVLILVIQTFPGPIPTFVASAPAFSNSRTASGVPTFLRSQKHLVNVFDMLDHIDDSIGMSMGNIDRNIIRHQSFSSQCFDKSILIVFDTDTDRRDQAFFLHF